jgi:integrase
MSSTMPRDTSTRHQGVFARHKLACALESGGQCDCQPSYWGKVYDRATGKYRKTQMLATPTAARAARFEVEAELARGAVPTASSTRVSAAIDAYLAAIRSGAALNKHGRRYKASAIRDLDGALNNYVRDALGRKRLVDVRRRDVQRLVDELTPNKSGSSVRTVVNAIRSLYTWAQDRELVEFDPAMRVKLPAMNATPRDRIATVEEMDELLAALDAKDALPYALAVYATARRAEIRHLRVEDVDLQLGVVYLGADENGRKTRAAQRAVPIVKPLAAMIRRELFARGRPAGEELVCPGHKPGGRNSGMLSFEALQTRADGIWKKAKLTRIAAHECRHTAISWLDAAGVRGYVVSRIAGHEVRGEAAAVTARYTHLLPDDLDVARKLFEAFLARRGKVARGTR